MKADIKMKKRFEEYTQYANVNFDLLNINLGDEKLINRYYSVWTNKYKTFFENNNEAMLAALSFRMTRSKKEIFASAQALEEAMVSRECGCITAYYYLCYYSLLHAMQSALYLNTDIGKEIVELSHKRICSIFVDCFCKQKESIIDKDIKQLYEEYRYLREYYSYDTPFNIIRDNTDETKLKSYVKQCYQLSSLHSIIIEKYNRKIKISEENYWDFENAFNYFNCKKDLSGNYYIKDEYDKIVFGDCVRGGIMFFNIVLDIENDYDNWGSWTYGKDLKINYKEYQNVKTNAFRIIYDALC